MRVCGSVHNVKLHLSLLYGKTRDSFTTQVVRYSKAVALYLPSMEGTPTYDIYMRTQFSYC
jgi:hypothetical protein